MGGKKGNRTKGNTRPSSSGHTAELLSASGVTGFVGFSGLATDVAGFVSSSLSDDVETTVDSDFRMVMKKTTKRDAVTKIKALQEFAELCQTKDETAVKGALPYWPRLFVKLSVDHDRRVREAAHQANKQIVTKVKKDLAPYLKSIMGVWVVSMCDPFVVAASAAQSAFQMAFPSSKQAGAFEFCKDEIFNYISDMLFCQTAKSLSDVETSTPEEMEAKYERMLASSLHGLKLYITTITDVNNEKTAQLLGKVLDENKFWKFANHKEVQIRTAWYIFIASLCQTAPQIAEKYASKLAPLTLGRLDEAHSTIAPLIWEAMLHLLLTVDDPWQYVNVQRAVFPQLWKFLREGGRGNAKTVCKNLLPFLSKIPESAYGERLPFYTELFSNFKQGILKEKTKVTCSESQFLVQAFFECLRYILLQNLDPSEEEIRIRQALLKEHLFPLVELAIMDPNCSMQKPFFSELGCFLRTVECQMNSEVASSRTEALNDILHLFWTNLFALNDKIFSADEEDSAQIILNRFAQFFHFLYKKDKKSLVPQKVKFLKDCNKPESSIEKHVDAMELQTQHTCMSNSVLVKNTHKLCSTILHKIISNPKVGYLNLLSEMVHTVPSKSLFIELLTTFNGGSLNSSLSETEYVTQFIEQVLLQWLSNRNIFGDNEQIIPSILGMILVACTCIPQEQAFLILNLQCTNKDYYVLEQLIAQIISKEGEIPNIHKWLKSEKIGKCMVALATEIADSDVNNVTCTSHSELWSLLKICFRASKDFEPVIGLEYLNEILTILTSVLFKHTTNADSGSTSKIVKFVCELAQSLFLNCLGCYQLTAVEDLLVCLFQLSFEKKLFTVEAQKHIQETWCLGTKQLVKFQGAFIKTGGFLCKATRIIQDQLLVKSYNFNQLADLSVVEDNTLCLLETVVGSLSDSQFFDKSCSIRSLLERCLPSPETNSELTSKLSDSYPERKLYDLDVPVVQIFADTKLLIPPIICINKCLLKVFNKLLSDAVSQEDSESIEESATLSESAKEFILPSVINSLLVMTFKRVLYVHPDVDYKLEVDGMFTEIESNLKYLLQLLSTEDFKTIFEKLFKLVETENNFVLSVFETTLQYIADKHIEVLTWLREKHLTFVNQKTNNVDFRLAQWLIPCSSDSMIQDIFATTAHILSNNGKELDITHHTQYLETLVCCLKFSRLNYSNQKLLKEVLIHLQELKSQSNKNFLCETLILENDENKVEFVRILCHLFVILFNHYPHILELWLWDFIVCTVCSWVNTLHQSKDSIIRKSENIQLACNIFSLLSLVKSFVMSPQIETIASHLKNEWKELYSPNVYSVILPLLFEVCEKTSKMDSNSWELEQMFYALSNCLHNLPLDDLMICISEMPEKSATPKEILSLVAKLSTLLTSKSHPVQWSSHYLLFILMPKVAELAAEESVVECENDQDQRERPPPLSLDKTLSTTGQIVDTMLAEFCVEDCCLVKPYTDSYTYTLAYLLSWRQLLKVFSCSNSEIRSEYALHLQNSKLLDSLLLNLFRLMPNNPTLTTTYTEICNPPTCNFSSSAQLQNIAYQVYLNTLSQLPALVRQWWNNQDKRTADYVNKFTTTNASTPISHEEIKSVQDTQVQFNNMFVKARPTAREVVATYTMEEITIELVIKLPANHPLGPVTVETGQRIGVGLTQWRHWMLQLTTFLTHQNGSILDGLSLWKRNVDKRFEGVEECMICFYVLHGATCQLPRLTCRTCKKKFHSACLYKWFSTSQNASCPLCRNLF